MRIKVYKNTLLSIILFGSLQLNAQKIFDLDIQATKLELDEKSLTGYVTGFDFPRDEVRRGWWKYARQFGSPLDMRTYYQVTIPSETTDGNVDLVIFSETISDGEKSTFKLGLEEAKYKVQVEELLKVFKKDFYIQHYLNELRAAEEEAEVHSRSYESAVLADEKSEALRQLNLKQETIELLKEEIRKVEGN